MATLAELHRAVQGVLASKRLGKPLFVRLHLQGVLEVEPSFLPALAKTAALVGQWLGQSPTKLFSQFSGNDRKGQCTLTLQFPSGATALVSECHGQPAGRGVSLIVLGSKGAAHHEYDAGGWHAWEQVAPSLGDIPAAEILAAIETTRKHLANPTPVRTPPTLSLIPPPQGHATGVRYGVLLVSGSHTHQEDYAAAFAADPRCRIVAVTDEKDVSPRRRRLNRQLARELVVPYEVDLEKALQRQDVHIVSVCAPPERRVRIAVRCAEAGKHLYLDKPLAPHLEEADALVAAVRKARVRSHMFSFITQPWAAEAKRLLERGKLGELLAIHADVFFAKGQQGSARLGTPRKEEYPPQRHQLAKAKRELDNIGVYPVTLIPWLTGQQFRTVYGVTGNYFFRQHQKHDVEDFGLLACTLEGGLPVTIAVGRCGWTSHPAGAINRLLLVGSERTALVDGNRPRLEVHTDEPPWTPPKVNPADPMGFWTSTQVVAGLRPKRTWLPLGPPEVSDVSDFLDRLDAGKDSEMSVLEAARATEVLLAGYLSASRGEVISLPLPR